ncbi:MAG: hypothetical protein JXR10_02495 [Cyclobacteriaceae bacterium]
MNKLEFYDKVQEVNIPNEWFTLKGGLPNDKLCYSKEASIHQVYYSEKGQKFDVQVFNTEGEALNKLLQELLKLKESYDKY